MAKNKKPQGTIEQAVAVAALKRAAKAIESMLEMPDIPAGSYANELSISIQGDVIVSAPQRVARAPKVETGEMLGTVMALCSEWYPDFDIQGVTNEVISTLKDGPDDLDIAGALALVKKVAGERAEQVKYFKPATTRKGAVTGQPFTRVHGVINSNDIDMEIVEATA